MNITTKDIARFWSKVDKSGECWEFVSPRMNTGYGLFSVKTERILAHRFAWIITNGTIPDGFDVCHHCDNRPCVRPDHLFVGTRSDNLRDMVSKGRQNFQKHPELRARGERNGNYTHPESRPHGESQGLSKLTEQQVIEIRQLEGISQKEIARRYGVSKHAIYCIQKRLTWRHV